MNTSQLKNENGLYSKTSFIKRVIQLYDYKLYRQLYKEYYPDWGGVKIIQTFFDCLWCAFLYGAIYPDYFEYGFVEKSHYSRKTYVTKGKSRKIQKILNKNGARFMYDKSVFNRDYSEFRTIKDFYFNDTKDNFVKFVRNCNHKIIVKPIFGESGHGIFIPDVSTEDKVSMLYEYLANSKDSFCEELFC